MQPNLACLMPPISSIGELEGGQKHRNESGETYALFSIKNLSDKLSENDH